MNLDIGTSLVVREKRGERMQMLSSLFVGRIPVGNTGASRGRQGSARVARGRRDLTQHLGHEDHELVQGLEPGNFPGHHMLHAPDQCPVSTAVSRPNWTTNACAGANVGLCSSWGCICVTSSILGCVWMGHSVPSGSADPLWRNELLRDPARECTMLALESHKSLVKLRSNWGQIVVSLRNKSVAIPKKCMSQSPFRQLSLGPGVSRHLRRLTGAVCEHACGGAGCARMHAERWWCPHWIGCRSRALLSHLSRTGGGMGGTTYAMALWTLPARSGQCRAVARRAAGVLAPQNL